MIKEWEDFFKFVKRRDKELDRHLIELSYVAEQQR